MAAGTFADSQPADGQELAVDQHLTLVANLSGRRIIELDVIIERPVRTLLAAMPHLTAGLPSIRQIDVLEVVDAMRLRRIRDRLAIRTRHYSHGRIGVGDGHSVDDELFAAAKTRNVRRPYDRHLIVI